jgi:hypothetical protein
MEFSFLLFSSDINDNIDTVTIPFSWLYNLEWVLPYSTVNLCSSKYFLGRIISPGLLSNLEHHELHFVLILTFDLSITGVLTRSLFSASIALGVTGTHQLPLHDKAVASSRTTTTTTTTTTAAAAATTTATTTTTTATNNNNNLIFNLFIRILVNTFKFILYLFTC